VDRILDAYEQVYTSGAVKEKALVVYDSMWNSTDKIAHRYRGRLLRSWRGGDAHGPQGERTTPTS
jgi:flavorubredoxin